MERSYPRQQGNHSLTTMKEFSHTLHFKERVIHVLKYLSTSRDIHSRRRASYHNTSFHEHVSLQSLLASSLEGASNLRRLGDYLPKRWVEK